jgi:hypothetical protein
MSPQNYQYFLGTAKQASSDYKSTTSYWINHIKKTYNYGNDIATALEQLQEADLSQHKPTWKSSQSKDKTIRELETEQFRIEFKTLFDVYIKRENTYQMNLLKTYTKRFKVANEVLESHLGGTIKLTKYITTMKDFISETESNYQNLSNMAFEQYCAYLYLLDRVIRKKMEAS